MGIGSVELLLILVVMLVYLAIPIVTLIYVLQIKKKVDRIESSLRRQNEQM